ncbi:hypothetical protein NDU88_005520 [Pleurodeles waltl]|uniref:Uncharacterized protein n=1 Tax=Pleurodeles waltl TaxID=8319 RepID=A0AAV7N1I6_PLEWA|nr:hypothetical protein NDU88_005520 [Pleurodeles waltl]
MRSPAWPLIGRVGWYGVPGRCSGSPGRSPPVGASTPFARLSRFPLRRGLALRSAPPPNGGRHSRAPDFEVPESGGHQDTLQFPIGTNRIGYGSGFGRMTEGSGALLECDRHLDARGHAPSPE